ncbi:hypothetical protein EVAR_26992_1 [Eumeta japonica]|uniref:Uncharacterized protein n=1 Tax=Eumeta variegata TaxID=151549 RepID=A0A4C1VJP3_EUMVA|nr:hypothetical protein EVAR_26992_1 [Eumeta japonica]
MRWRATGGGRRAGAGPRPVYQKRRYIYSIRYRFLFLMLLKGGNLLSGPRRAVRVHSERGEFSKRDHVANPPRRRVNPSDGRYRVTSVDLKKRKSALAHVQNLLVVFKIYILLNNVSSCDRRERRSFACPFTFIPRGEALCEHTAAIQMTTANSGDPNACAGITYRALNYYRGLDPGPTMARCTPYDRPKLKWPC